MASSSLLFALARWACVMRLSSPLICARTAWSCATIARQGKACVKFEVTQAMGAQNLWRRGAALKLDLTRKRKIAIDYR
jgi:hypothetical protein